MLPPMLLGARPGHTVLDLCAAPGSKTLQLLDAMHGSGGGDGGGSDGSGGGGSGGGCASLELSLPIGLLVANDVSRPRAVVLAQRSRRQARAPLLVTSFDGAAFPTLYAHEPGLRGARKVGGGGALLPATTRRCPPLSAALARSSHGSPARLSGCSSAHLLVCHPPELPRLSCCVACRNPVSTSSPLANGSS